ncbi:MAG: hypothetical protein KF871_15940 [Hydrogenophaga sp.]|uniref:hypothetical protein n=1 Tax=Hydrogenophaga sp. TaxID=1904254 RepID=UPI001D47BB88|nr:hypothetical protein [Hydrogenophaga sp.]MBX3611385.1 hypothetical protein [Hydrogenophaga sp.]
MDVAIVEDLLQKAAEHSSAWAVVREEGSDAWIVVLRDETLLDAEYDGPSQQIRFRAELGLVADTAQRHAINELILRSQGVIPMPALGLAPDNRYELLANWSLHELDAVALGAELDHLTEQIQLWRDVVAQPLMPQKPSMPLEPNRLDIGMFA